MRGARTSGGKEGSPEGHQEVGRTNLHELHDGRNGVASQEAGRDHGRCDGIAHHISRIKRRNQVRPGGSRRGGRGRRDGQRSAEQACGERPCRTEDDARSVGCSPKRIGNAAGLRTGRPRRRRPGSHPLRADRARRQGGAGSNYKWSQQDGRCAATRARDRAACCGADERTLRLGRKRAIRIKQLERRQQGRPQAGTGRCRRAC